MQRKANEDMTYSRQRNRSENGEIVDALDDNLFAPIGDDDILWLQPNSIIKR
jgi:hypothetical protein